MSFPKEKVFLLKRGEGCARMYVVFDDKVKTLKGLQLPPDFMPKDYYVSFAKANEQAKKNAPNEVANAHPTDNPVRSTEPSIRASTTATTDVQTSTTPANDQPVQQTEASASLAAQAAVNTDVEEVQ